MKDEEKLTNGSEPTKEPINEEPETTEVIEEIKSSTGKVCKNEVTHPKNYATIFSIIALIASIVALSLFSADYLSGYVNFNTIKVYENSSNNAVTFPEGASVSEIAAAVSPAVVSIVTETRTSSWLGSYDSSAAGTGFIVTEDGFVVTNKHVVDGAKSIKIVLDDGTEYDDIKLIGTDPLNDAAILKINGASGLKTVALGDTKTLEVGQQVVAIGNALGQYQNSVTAGVISGTGRSLTASSSDGSSYENLSDMLQTDAAINGGNSGGPLMNAAGEVIGINTAYASDSQSIGFAIPITSVKGLIRDAIKTGKVQRAVLGVRYYALTPSSAKDMKLPVSAGAYLYTSASVPVITPGSAGEKAGLKEKDIITAVNDVKIGSAGSLSTLIGEYSVGDTVKLTVLRGDKTITVNVTLSAYTE